MIMLCIVATLYTSVLVIGWIGATDKQLAKIPDGSCVTIYYSVTLAVMTIVWLCVVGILLVEDITWTS